MRRVIAFFIMLFVSAKAASTQTPQSPRSTPLLGVFDQLTGEPLAGVQVRDEFSGTYAITTATGTVRLTYLSFRGTAAVVELSKIGYEAKTMFVVQGDTTPITEVLERVTTLAPVITTETYRIDRDEGHWGGFARRYEQRNVAMHTSVIPPPYCEPSIFVDGFWWNPHITSPIDMTPNTPPSAPFTPTNVKGVEVYPTGAPRPLRFEGDPLCGAIVIWTK